MAPKSTWMPLSPRRGEREGPMAKPWEGEGRTRAVPAAASPALTGATAGA